MELIRAIRPWLLFYVFIIMFAALLAYTVNALYMEAASKLPWDGTYTCEPGTTYTIKECP